MAKKFPVFDGTTVHSQLLALILSHASNPISRRSILILFSHMHMISKWLCPIRLSSQSFAHISRVSHACYKKDPALWS